MPRSTTRRIRPSARRARRAIAGRRAHAPRLALLAVGALLVAGCYQDPAERLDEAQAQLDLTATLEDLGNRSTELQFQLDSLRGVVARQDTTIARLANLAGVPYPR